MHVLQLSLTRSAVTASVRRPEGTEGGGAGSVPPSKSATAVIAKISLTLVLFDFVVLGLVSSVVSQKTDWLMSQK